MKPSSSIREQRDIATFERERRLTATRSIALVFFGLLSILTILFSGFAVFGAFFHVSLVSLLLTIVMLVICVALYGFGARFAGQGRLQISVLSTLGGALLSIILITVFWKFLLGRGISDVLLTLLAAACVAIVLASAIGEQWMIYATTAVMNVLTVFLLGLFPLASGETLLAFAVALNIQWATAAISIATSGNYRRTLDELGNAYAQVQRLDDLKDQFITNINHELRTPIMTLHGYVEYLRSSRHEMDGEEEEEMFSRASRAGYNLVTLLSSILDNRRIDQSAEDFTPAPVPLFETLQAALLLLDPRESDLGEHELHIKIHRNVTILGDSVRLQQVLINLISNAIKYSPPATPIFIDAHVVTRAPTRGWSFRQLRETQPELIEITVRDMGFGIPPDQISLLFNRFVRLPRDLASTIVGNGLGLYLCRVLANAMGGDIWVESTGNVGEGSTFHVILQSAMTQDEEGDAEATDPRMQVISVGSSKKAR